MATHETTSASRRTIRALIALNVILGLALLAEWTPTTTASANSPTTARRPQGVVNPADQRRDMIKELRKVNQKLDAMKEKLSAPLDVRVIDMPSAESD